MFVIDKNIWVANMREQVGKGFSGSPCFTELHGWEFQGIEAFFKDYKRLIRREEKDA